MKTVRNFFYFFLSVAVESEEKKTNQLRTVIEEVFMAQKESALV